MALTKIKIKNLVTLVDERNTFGLNNFFGINKDKEYMPTVADTSNVDPRKYKVVRKGRFVYSGMQTGRDNCIRIGMYFGEEPILVSPAYTTFEVTNTNMIIPEYFHMIFLSKEKDRFGSFLSDGSIRANLDWSVFCDIELNLPSINVQQKYVDIYKGMIENQKSYERGLEDLKLVCDATIESIRKKYKQESIQSYIERVDVRNEHNKCKNVKNVSVRKEFSDVTSKVNRNELSNYKIVLPRQISFVQTTHNEHVFCNAMNMTEEPIVVTSVNEVFSCDEIKLLPEYLCLNFNRTEFDRYARFHSWGSAREIFSWNDLINVKLSIPPLDIQRAISDIYLVYRKRKSINEKLKNQLKNICPILIKGSIKRP